MATQNKLKYDATLETLSKLGNLVEANLIYTDLTKKELAGKLGCSANTLTSLINGDHLPSFTIVVTLLEWLKETDPEGRCFKLVKRMVGDG